MKKFAKILFGFAFILCIPFALAACGGGAAAEEPNIVGFEFKDSYKTMVYNQDLGSDIFGVKVVYKDGTKVALSEVSAEDLDDIEISISRLDWDTGEIEQWGSSEKLDAGQYTVTYSCGNASASATLDVEKADFNLHGIEVIMSPQIITYGDKLPEPRVNFVYDQVRSVNYYYQEANSNNDYSEDYHEYNYQSDAVCDILPGNYQLYAVFTTKNYNDITTMLKNFTVKKINKNNYALFTNESGQFEPLNNKACDVQFDYNKKVSDYVKQLSSVYVCEVDQGGHLLIDEQGQPVNAIDISYAYNQESMSVNFQDEIVEKGGERSVTFGFSENTALYNETQLTLKLNIKKLSIYVYVPQNLMVDTEDNYYSVKYDGKLHHVLVGDNVSLDDGVYYACSDDGQKLYSISNYAKTDAGEYEVQFEIVDEMKDTLQFDYFDNDGIHCYSDTFTVGSWEIEKKELNVEADVHINEIAIDENNQYNMTFTAGETYHVDVQNIVVKDGEEITQFVADYEIQVLRVQDGWIEVTEDDGITIDQTNKTISISEHNFMQDPNWNGSNLLAIYVKYTMNDSNYEVNTILDITGYLS